MTTYTCVCGQPRIAGGEHECGNARLGAPQPPGFDRPPAFGRGHTHEIIDVESYGVVVSRFCAASGCDWEDRAEGWGPPLSADVAPEEASSAAARVRVPSWVAVAAVFALAWVAVVLGWLPIVPVLMATSTYGLLFGHVSARRASRLDSEARRTIEWS